ncbi:hypothetical protein ACSBR2_004585 [Camellia fascicularis]
MASRALLGALVERWWDTTNSFHFSSSGEITMTSHDFSMIIGLGVGGDPMPFDMGRGNDGQIQLVLQALLRESARDRGRSKAVRPGLLDVPPRYHLVCEQVEHRGFVLTKCPCDLTRAWFYDWGGTGLTTLYGYMSSTSRIKGEQVGGYWKA